MKPHTVKIPHSKILYYYKTTMQFYGTSALETRNLFTFLMKMETQSRQYSASCHDRRIGDFVSTVYTSFDDIGRWISLLPFLIDMHFIM